MRPPADTRVRIGIQERQRLYREGLALILEDEPDLEVVAIARTSTDLVAATARTPFDLAVLELDVEEWDACHLVAILRKRHPGLCVVGITAGSDTRVPASAYRAGVRSVFARNAGVGTFLRTIRSLPNPSAAAAMRLDLLRVSPVPVLLASV